MEVYSIRLKSARNTNIFIVSCELGEIVLHGDSIVKFGVAKGFVDNDKFKEAIVESDELRAFDIAGKYMASALKTEKQLKDYLKRKEFNKLTIDSVVCKLKDYCIIDDKNYLENYKKSNKNFSKNKIRQKMFLAGVNVETIDDALMDLDDFESCLYNAEKFLKNKQVDKKTIGKLMRRLLSQGYTYETIRKVLKSLNAESEEC